MVSVFYTGGSVNPCRSFGPAVVTGRFEGYHWIYWVGPALGTLLATAFYKFIKILEYESANPGQDDDRDVERDGDVEKEAGLVDGRRKGSNATANTFVNSEDGGQYGGQPGMGGAGRGRERERENGMGRPFAAKMHGSGS